MNQKHWAKVNSIRERGKNNPNFKHGLSAIDPQTGKQDPQKRKKLEQIYSKYPITCQNPNCKKVFMIRHAEKDTRKFCSLKCHGTVSNQKRERNKLGRYTS